MQPGGEREKNANIASFNEHRVILALSPKQYVNNTANCFFLFFLPVCEGRKIKHFHGVIKSSSAAFGLSQDIVSNCEKR